MTVEVWSDIVCPWCRLGKAQLDVALARFEHAPAVSVVWRSFELDPSAPPIREETLEQQLAVKLGRRPDEIASMHEQMQQRGAALGIDFRFDIAQSGNTFDGHRLLHLARDRGRQNALASALFQAYFTDGEPIGDPSALQRIAESCGLDPDEVREVLSSDAYARDVRADEEAARAMQVSGVPFFVFDGRFAASGAQPPEVLLAGLEQAWASRS
jgi:predicted DsbA family dithiol-disulfide isomerase